jgi:hypothetical protein
MLSAMRRHQQTLLLFVTVIIIIAFVWLYNDYNIGGSRGDGKVGTVYDKPVPLAVYQRGARRLTLSQELQMAQLFRTLAGKARSMDEVQPNFVFGTYVLRHEAATLGAEPDDSEVIAAIKQMPVFMTNGAFDPTKYQLFNERLSSLGFGTDAIEDLVRDDLRVGRLVDLVGATISASPSEVREEYARQKQKVEVAFVRLKEEDIAKDIQLTDADIAKAFEERKETMKTEELRKAKFVSFKLSQEEEKLTGRERGDALQKLLDQSSEFSIAMTEKDASFDAVAQKLGVEVKETPEFPLSAPPEAIGRSFAAASALFLKLSTEQPNSDPIPTEDRKGYLVLQLAGITPPRPQTLEEVKEKLAATLKQERTSEAMAKKAADLRQRIDAALKTGKSFADAASEAGATAETLPAFSQSEPPAGDSPVALEIMQAALSMKEGQLSEVLPTGAGSVVFRIEKQLPIDEADFEKEKASIAERIKDMRTRSVFSLWFEERRQAANIQSAIGA